MISKGATCAYRLPRAHASSPRLRSTAAPGSSVSGAISVGSYSRAHTGNPSGGAGAFKAAAWPAVTRRRRHRRKRDQLRDRALDSAGQRDTIRDIHQARRSDINAPLVSVATRARLSLSGQARVSCGAC